MPGFEHYHPFSSVSDLILHQWLVGCFYDLLTLVTSSMWMRQVPLQSRIITDMTAEFILSNTYIFMKNFKKLIFFFFCSVTHFIDSSLFSSNSVSLFLTHQHLFHPSYNILCLARDSKKYWIFSEWIQSKPESLFLW